MKKSIFIFLFCFLPLLFCFLPLFAERGIVVACNDGYAKYLIPSLTYLRREVHCALPIEVWYAGDELSKSTMEKLAEFKPIAFRDMEQVLGSFDGNYRGFHIKAYMLHATDFDEVVLMDADVYFYQDPAKLFEHPSYKATGAYFFRDKKWKYPKLHPVEKYRERRTFFRSLIASPSAYLPKEWSHYWTTDRDPTKRKPFLEAHQESGCLAFDKKRHKQGLIEVVKLNKNRKETYNYVYGDKETYWLGLEIAEEPYAVNATYPCSLRCDGKTIHLVHYLDGRLFFHQKHPIKVDKTASFYEDDRSRAILKDEMEQINRSFSCLSCF